MLHSISSDNENISASESNNHKNTLEINECFIELINFLHVIQGDFRKNISINSSGRINRESISQINNKFKGEELIEKMNTDALSFYKSHTDEFKGCTDCLVIAGALICIYDSSILKPKYYKNCNSRGEKKTLGNFSVLGIDTNESHRYDGVNPSTSLHHEFQHHLNTTLGDQVLHMNSRLNFTSAERFTDPPRGFQSKSNFVAKTDSELIGTLFGRPINLQSSHPAIKTEDYQMYENQLYYLDELSASWGQAKSNTYGPKMKFYNNIRSGNHYDLIGDSGEDRNDLVELFTNYLMPGLYLFELVKKHQEEIDNQGTGDDMDNIDKSIKKAKIKELELKKDNINNAIILITQTIGISRTVHQALELISYIWKHRVLPYLSSDYERYIYSGRDGLKKYL